MSEKQQDRFFWLSIRNLILIPLLVGLIAALLAIGITFLGMMDNGQIMLINLRTVLLVTILAGGSWGLIAWGWSFGILVFILILRGVVKKGR